jgi:hypothetical protein
VDEPKTEKKPFMPNSLKWVTSTIIGVGSGLAKFVADVRTEFYDNIINAPDFEAERIEHGNELGRLKKERRAIGSTMTTEEFIKQFHNQKNKFTDQFNTVAEELGIVSKGPNGYVKGSIQRFQTLSENARTPVVFGAVSATVIGFAGTSMFLNSLASRKKLDTIIKHPHDQQPQR